MDQKLPELKDLPLLVVTATVEINNFMLDTKERFPEDHFREVKLIEIVNQGKATEPSDYVTRLTDILNRYQFADKTSLYNGFPHFALMKTLGTNSFSEYALKMKLFTMELERFSTNPANAEILRDTLKLFYKQISQDYR